MLTPSDLHSIESMMDRVLETKLEQKLEEKLESKFEEKLAPIRKDIRALKKSTTLLRNDLEMVLGNLDARELKLRGRDDKIEIHLGLSHAI